MTCPREMFLWSLGFCAIFVGAWAKWGLCSAWGFAFIACGLKFWCGRSSIDE